MKKNNDDDFPAFQMRLVSLMRYIKNGVADALEADIHDELDDRMILDALAAVLVEGVYISSTDGKVFMEAMGVFSKKILQMADRLIIKNGDDVYKAANQHSYM